MSANITKSFHLLVLLVCVMVGLAAGPAQASFHTYTIVQIYSNADGSVQYVELLEQQHANGQNFLNGLQLVSGSKTFTMPANLPSSATSNTHVLYATQAFANLGVVTPDYIIPANFLSITGGTVTYANVSTVSYPALPTNGNAIASNGTSVTPAPTNFAGQTGSLQATPSFNPQAGFWYNPAEGGRGFVIEIHGSNLFIGGFMYDASGNAIWYASGPAAMSNATTYTNVWQQYGGGQSLTGAFKPSSVVNANVGALTIQFTSATDGKLTLPTGTQIPITRFPF